MILWLMVWGLEIADLVFLGLEIVFIDFVWGGVWALILVGC